jgi:hypothetical protein
MPRRYVWGAEVWLHSFLNLSRRRREWSPSRSGHFVTGKGKGLVGPKSWYGQFRKRENKEGWIEGDGMSLDMDRETRILKARKRWEKDFWIKETQCSGDKPWMNGRMSEPNLGARHIQFAVDK